MRTPHKLISASGAALTTLAGFSFAQGLAPPPVPATAPVPSAVFDPQQFPAIRGEIERFTLTGRNNIDGFILKDGTEVKTAPDLATQIAYAFKPGDRVTVRGLKAAALPLVLAVSITDEHTHRTVIDSSTAGNPRPQSVRPPPPGRIPSSGPVRETSGTIRMALHGPQGEINGLLLENGEILRFPPDQTAQLTAAMQPHQPIVAEGIETTTALGTVVEVRELGISRDRMVAVGPPPPAGPVPGPGAPPASPAT